MMVNALEVSGIEGNFRSVCESVMRVLRENKDSVMAMLEAFVHDPLINWRLVGETRKHAPVDDSNKSTPDGGNEDVVEEKDRGRDRDSDESNDAQASLHKLRRPLKRRQSASTLQMQIQGGLSRSNSTDVHVSLSQSFSVRRYEHQEQHSIVEINMKALNVINRISKKLNGADFDSEPLEIKEQVDRLIQQATSDENLSLAYVGWCAFW